MITLAAQVEQLLTILLVVVLSLIGSVGFGAVALLLRAILPGVGRAADASLARLGTRRLLLVGILPLVGAALLARAVHASDNRTVEGLYALLVALPLALATVVGAMAALPHLGGQVLRSGLEASPLARASVGGLVTGLAMVSWLLPPLGVLVSALVAGWWIGIGLGGLVRRAQETALEG
jgi:hypothetical protein